ncbi:Nn.00g039270.m01.CDS01 [Neocucurbitaria sp. VM-36]
MAEETIVLSHDTPYHGQPLGVNEVRLLAIKRHNDALHLATQVHKLDHIPEYAAVSYVWGTTPASKIASCNNRDLLITQSAFEMLQYLDADRLFWIDAICINQNDAEEKAIQIPLMEQLFSKAAFVVVWTGISTPQTRTFMTELPRVLENARRWVSNIAKNIDPSTREDCTMPSQDHPFWVGCYQLLHNQWFKRFWTFQEVIFAKRSIIFSDSAWIYPDDLIEFVLEGRLKGYFHYEQESIGYFCGNYADADRAILDLRFIPKIRLSLQANSNQTFPYLLFDLRHRQVKEPVDRIWGVAALLSGDKRQKLASIVDYSVTGRKEYWKTYLGAFRILITEMQTLQLLSIPPVIRTQRDVIPTWCPDISKRFLCSLSFCEWWNYPVNHGAQFYRDLLIEEPGDENDSFGRRAAIAEHDKKSISFRENGTQLCVQGFVVDKIVEVVEDTRLQGALDYVEEASAARLLRHALHPINMNWHLRSLSLARRLAYGTSQDKCDIPKEYLMTLLADCRIKRDLPRAYNEAVTQLTTDFNINSLSLELRHQVRRVIERITELAGHSFFATKSGRFGLAKPGCKPGDQLCVFYGGHPLYVLRRSRGDGFAEFCGSAFVPYLMEPQQSDAARIGPDEIFVIR